MEKCHQNSTFRKVAICLDPDPLRTSKFLLYAEAGGDPLFLKKKKSKFLFCRTSLKKNQQVLYPLGYLKRFFLFNNNRLFNEVRTLSRQDLFAQLNYILHMYTILMVSEMACPAKLILQRAFIPHKTCAPD